MMKCPYCFVEGNVEPIMMENEGLGGVGKVIDDKFTIEQQANNNVHTAMTIDDDIHGRRTYPMYECIKCGFMFFMRKPDK